MKFSSHLLPLDLWNPPYDTSLLVFLLLYFFISDYLRGQIQRNISMKILMANGFDGISLRVLKEYVLGTSKCWLLQCFFSNSKIFCHCLKRTNFNEMVVILIILTIIKQFTLQFTVTISMVLIFKDQRVKFFPPFRSLDIYPLKNDHIYIVEVYLHLKKVLKWIHLLMLTKLLFFEK